MFMGMNRVIPSAQSTWYRVPHVHGDEPETTQYNDLIRIIRAGRDAEGGGVPAGGAGKP